MPRESKPFFRRLIEFRYLFVINFLVLAILGAAFGREYLRSYEIQKDIDRLQQQADELAARNFQIMELKTALQTESYIEREARLKLGLKKPGEEVVVVQAGNPALKGEPARLVQVGGAEADDSAVAVANPTKWWYYFFDKKSYNELNSQ